MISILAAHEYYSSENPSGENLSFDTEVGLLRTRGHEVTTYTISNDEIATYGPIRKMGLAWRTLWNPASKRHLKNIMGTKRPDVAHFQNTFPLMSPSIYSACQEEGIPIVQSLRNFRLFCPAAVLYRDGRICEDCLGRKVAWPGILHGCYQKSRLYTTVVAAMTAVHHAMNTWINAVDMFITPSEFARRKLAEGGIPIDNITVKSNFLLKDPGVSKQPGNGAVFVGRLSEEKGLRTMMEAIKKANISVLRIVGDGPMLKEVREAAGMMPDRNIEVLGRRKQEEVLTLIRGAAFLIFPSEWYETFGRVAMESFACGVPVIASRLGAIAEIVEDKRTGLLFNPGDPIDLADKMEWAMTHPEKIQKMGNEARQEYELKFTAERNYSSLMDIYRRAIDIKRQRYNKRHE